MDETLFLNIKKQIRDISYKYGVTEIERSKLEREINTLLKQSTLNVTGAGV